MINVFCCCIHCEDLMFEVVTHVLSVFSTSFSVYSPYGLEALSRQKPYLFLYLAFPKNCAHRNFLSMYIFAEMTPKSHCFKLHISISL